MGQKYYLFAAYANITMGVFGHNYNSCMALCKSSVPFYSNTWHLTSCLYILEAVGCVSHIAHAIELDRLQVDTDSLEHDRLH